MSPRETVIETEMYCPCCGEATKIVRHIMNHMYEIFCEDCDDTHVLLLHDRQTLPSAMIQA